MLPYSFPPPPLQSGYSLVLTVNGLSASPQHRFQQANSISTSSTNIPSLSLLPFNLHCTCSNMYTHTSTQIHTCTCTHTKAMLLPVSVKSVNNYCTCYHTRFTLVSEQGVTIGTNSYGRCTEQPSSIVRQQMKYQPSSSC